MAMYYKNDLSAAIHELAEDLHRHGAIDKQTMSDFDESCLSPAEEFSPVEKPGGSALRLLTLIRDKGLGGS